MGWLISEPFRQDLIQGGSIEANVSSELNWTFYECIDGLKSIQYQFVAKHEAMKTTMRGELVGRSQRERLRRRRKEWIK